MKRLTKAERMQAFVEKVRVIPCGGCWEWTASLIGRYGGFWDGERLGQAHRWSYEQIIGPIPEGLQLDHLCRNRVCVNPAHPEPVTQRENIMRGEGPTAIAARKTVCSHGHEFTPSNTYNDTRGHRRCRECMRANFRQWYAKKKEPQP